MDCSIRAGVYTEKQVNETCRILLQCWVKQVVLIFQKNLQASSSLNRIEFHPSPKPCVAVSPWPRLWCCCHQSARPRSPAAFGAWYPGSRWRFSRTFSRGRISAQVGYKQTVKSMCIIFIFEIHLIWYLNCSLPWSICRTGAGAWSSLSLPGPASPETHKHIKEGNEPSDNAAAIVSSTIRYVRTWSEGDWSMDTFASKRRK